MYFNPVWKVKMQNNINHISYASIFSSVIMKVGLCSVAPVVTLKILSRTAIQNNLEAFDEMPVKPLFSVCILNVIGSDVTNLFEKFHQDYLNFTQDSEFIENDSRSLLSNSDNSNFNETLNE